MSDKPIPSAPDLPSANPADAARQAVPGGVPSVPTTPSVPSPNLPTADSALGQAGQNAAVAAGQNAASQALAGGSPQDALAGAGLGAAQSAAQSGAQAAMAQAGVPTQQAAQAQQAAQQAAGALGRLQGPSTPTPSPGAAPPASPSAPASAPASARTPTAAPPPPAARRGQPQGTPEELARYSNNLGSPASVIQSILSGASQTNRVEYLFSCVGDDATHWRVRRYGHTEAVSELYEVVLDLWTDLGEGDPANMLGTSADVTVRRDTHTRSVQGIVWRYEELQGTQRSRAIRVWIVPAAFVLTQRSDSRIFQDMNAVDITREVIEAGLADYNREIEYRVQRTLFVREYCVQYRESDYAFVSRLLESEGLFFWFEPTEDGAEKMIVGDRSASAERIDSADGGELVVKAVASGAQHDEVVHDFVRRESRETSETVAGEFDWITPSRRLKETSGGNDGNSRKRQAYLPKPSASVRSSTDNGGRDLVDQARLHQEEQSAKTQRAFGLSSAIGMMPGRGVMIVQNAEPTLDGEYVILRVEHHGLGIATAEEGGAAREGGDELQGADYGNRFWVIPKALPYRAPRLTPKPRHFGPMTATVVGPNGAELYTDEHGRIKVQFHWDRLGSDDERSSCFMRVTQPWAGNGWGVLFIPRIGMECVVSFLYDDIDQPLITGSVYNGTNPPPFGMPDDATRSGWKTKSTPSSEGYNEISFEDKAGGEEIRLQAEKDFNELVKHNHSTTVKCNQTNSVSAEQSISVGGNRSVSVKKNETYTIDLDRTTHVKGNDTNTVDKDRKTTITGEDIETIQKKMTGTYNKGRFFTVNTEDDELTVNGVNKKTTVHGQYLNTVDVQYKVSQGAHTQLALQDYIFAATNGRAQLKSQNSNLDLNNDKATLNATSEIALTCGASSITLKSDGTITISGSMKVEVGSGASSVKVEPAGVNVGGPKISSAAIGIHEITGAVVKIN